MVQDMKASGEDNSHSDDDSFVEQDELNDDSMGELDEQESLKTSSKDDGHLNSMEELGLCQGVESLSSATDVEVGDSHT